ncbi:MAG: hypothetical protein AB7N91_29915 [Candidatus Tectimicrobiota bacterium]
MILAKRSLPATIALLCCLGCWGGQSGSGAAQSRLAPESGRKYGPTVPGGYYIRVTPRSVRMSQPQRPQMTVNVEDAHGQPVDDVLVTFAPSEGEVTVGQSRTRGGMVTGTFSAAAGSDSPRTAALVVTVENVEVTVFIDIVPAVFGR